MITHVQAQAKSTVYFHAFFPGVAAPTVTVQNRNPTSLQYRKYWDLANAEWSATPVENPMVPDASGVYMSAAFNHAEIDETAADVYAVVFNSHGATPQLECELWTFGSSQATQLREMHQYLLAQRVEISRPDSFTVVRNFFDAKVGGQEVLRFTSRQNITGSPEEVQVNDSNMIPVYPPPVTPINFTAVPSISRVDLAWLSTGASAYILFRSTGGASPLFLATTNVNSYIDTAVLPGVEYTYFVASMSGLDYGDLSAPVAVTPLGPAPTTPLNFTVTPGDEVVSLSWQAVADATSYTVWRATSALGTPVQIGAVTSPVFNDTPVVNDTSYWYSVRAVNTWGVSPATSTLVATPHAVIPGTPTNPAAVAGNGTVSLSWTAGVNNIGFNVYRAVGVGAPVFLATTVTAGYIDTTVVNGTIYSYTVTGIAGARESAPTSAVSAHPVGDPPVAATNLIVSAGDGAVNLTWDAAAGATGYKIMRSDTANPEVQIGTSTVTSYADTTVINGTTYTYTVVATNAWGDAAATDPEQATPAYATPGVPTALAATPGDNSVHLTWTAGVNNTRFNVYRAEGVAAAVLLGPSLTNGFTDGTAVNGVEYTYTVTGVNGPLESLPSVAATATPSP